MAGKELKATEKTVLMHSRGIINKKELRLCKEKMLKKYKPPLDPYKNEV